MGRGFLSLLFLFASCVCYGAGDNEQDQNSDRRCAQNVARQAQSVSDWKNSFEANRDKALELLGDLKNHARVVRAFAAAKIDPEFVLNNLKAFRLNEPDEFRVFRSVALRLPEGSDLVARAVGQSRLTEEHKRKIFQIRWDRNHGESDEHEDFFQLYAFKDKNAFYKILKIYAARDPLHFFEEFGDDVEKLPVSQRVGIGRVLALVSELDEERWVEQLALPTAKARAEVLKAVVTRVVNDWNWRDDYLTEFLFNNENWFQIGLEESCQVVLSVLQGVRPGKLRNKDDREAFVRAWCPEFERNGIAQEIQGILFRRDPLMMMAAEVGVHEVGELQLIGEDGEVTIQTVLATYSDKHPKVLPENHPDFLWDRLIDRQVAERLLGHYIRYSQRDEFIAAPRYSLDLIFQIVGFDLQHLEVIKLPGRLSHFVKMLLDIQDLNKTPVFSDVNFSPEVFKDSDSLFDFIGSLRSYLYLKGAESDWSSIKRAFLQGNEVSLANLKRFTQWLQKQVTDEIRRALSATAGKITTQDLKRLENMWGDLEPLYTLIARFRTRRVWHKNIEVLGQIVRAELDGKFQQFKFFGLSTVEGSQDASREQLEMLSYDAVKRLMKFRGRLSVWKGDNSKPEKNEKTEDPEEILESLRAKLVESPQTEVISEEEEDAFEEKVLKVDILRANPQQVMAGLVGGNYERAQDYYAIARRTLLDGGRSREAKRGAARALQALIHQNEVLQAEDKRDVITSLKNIDRLLKEAPKRSGRGDAIVFSALSSDPLETMTVGDLVPKVTCLSYRTGGMINALLADTVDGNTLLASSFILKPEDFVVQEDFERLFRHIQERKSADIVWDGNQRVAKFRLGRNAGSEEVWISTRRLEYAALRAKLKVGEKKSGAAALKFEKEYFIDHPALGRMRAHHQALMNELGAEIGAVTEGSVRVRKSKHAGGTYSDLARPKGVKRDEHYILY